MITALGLMCGTSVDAIDVAWLRSDGEATLEFGPTQSLPVPEDARAIIKAAMNEAREVKHRNERTELMIQAEDLVDALHIQAISKFAKEFPEAFQQVELIGYHGQTVFHAPEKGITIQLGRGEKLAQQFKIPVVYDFRAADVMAGGQGAPLVPIFHQALARHYNLPQPCVFVNIGGVANVSWVGGASLLPSLGEGAPAKPQAKHGADEGFLIHKDPHPPLRGTLSQVWERGSHLLAFDCGPGNALIDDAMIQLFQKPYDDGGQVALSGEVDEKALRHLLSHPFFSQKPPKSLDRNGFDVSSVIARSGAQQSEAAIQQRHPSEGRDPETKKSGLLRSARNDEITTLTEFTVQAIIKSAEHFPEPPQLWLIAGGGARNVYIMQRLQACLHAPVHTASHYNISEDFLEAQAFAYLAIRSQKRLPLTFPQTTGVKEAMSGGVYISMLT